MAPKQLMLVGSVPLETAEEVIRTFGGPLGPHLATIPDGEIGERRRWITRLHYHVMNGHPDLEVLRRPTHEPGHERLLPHDESDAWQFKVRSGVTAIHFDSPGWRLGYAEGAVNSYFVFRTLRESGVIPPHLRFQVSLPMVNSVVAPRTFPDLDDLDRVKLGYEAALRAEIEKILELIPADDLAIQWDCSWEITDVYGGISEFPKDGAIERNVQQVRDLAPSIPEPVELGYHFCFGTFGGWPRFAPDDLGEAVRLANAFIAESGRPVTWVHIPTLDVTNEAFYAPLADLRPNGAQVFLGMIHNMERFPDRLAVARKFIPDFGLAAPCGFGRMSPEQSYAMIEDHLKAVEVAYGRA